MVAKIAPGSGGERQAHQQETLPSITIGRTRRIPLRALEEFIATCEAEQGGYAPHPAPVGHIPESGDP